MCLSFMYLQCISSQFGQHRFVAFLFGTGVCTFRVENARSCICRKVWNWRTNACARKGQAQTCAEMKTCPGTAVLLQADIHEALHLIDLMTQVQWRAQHRGCDTRAEADELVLSRSGQSHSEPFGTRISELKEDAAREGHVGRLQYFSARCLFFATGTWKN